MYLSVMWWSFCHELPCRSQSPDLNTSYATMCSALEPKAASRKKLFGSLFVHSVWNFAQAYSSGRRKILECKILSFLPQKFGTLEFSKYIVAWRGKKTSIAKTTNFHRIDLVFLTYDTCSQMHYVKKKSFWQNAGGYISLVWGEAPSNPTALLPNMSYGFPSPT